jgi:Amidohydrolase
MVKVPHGGGFLPAMIERLRHAADFRPEPRSKGYTGDPLDVMKRLYYDTLTFSPAALRYLVELVGAERLMLGSDYPFEMAETDPVAVTKAGGTGGASRRGARRHGGADPLPQSRMQTSRKTIAAENRISMNSIQVRGVISLAQHRQI